MNNYQLAAAILAAAIAAAPKAIRGRLAVEEHDPTQASYEGAFSALNDSETEEDALRAVDVYVDDDGMWMVDRSDHTNGEVDPRPMTAAYLQAALAWVASGEFKDPDDAAIAEAEEEAAMDASP